MLRIIRKLHFSKNARFKKRQFGAKGPRCNVHLQFQAN